jgi:branched-chain amino acid transport system permease protein
MTLQIIAQVVVSGILIGLIYALIAAGLSLIFGLMDVVNFAHGEFLMVAMYATFTLYVAFSLDPLVSLPVVVALMFLGGWLTYHGVVVRAFAAKANAGMAQIFSTFGLAVMLRGLAQVIYTPDYRSIRENWLSDVSYNVLGVFLPLSQLVAGGVCLVAFGVLYLLITRTDFGRALEATREDSEAVALVGIDRHRIYALGWGIGAAAVGVAGVLLATFYYIHPGVGLTFGLIAYVTVALGGFGSLAGALVGGVLIGLVEALSAFLVAPSLKQVGVFLLYLVVVVLRPRGLLGRF